LQAIGALSDNLVACHVGRFYQNLENGSGAQLVILNREGDLIKKHFPFNIPLVYELSIGISSGINGGLSYFKMLDPTIYQINSDMTTAVNWKFDFSYLSLDTTYLFQPGPEGAKRFDKLAKEGQFADFMNIHQCSTSLMAGIYFNKSYYYLLIPNGTHDIHTLQNDSTGCMGTSMGIPIKEPVGTYKESFITSISAIDWLERISTFSEEHKVKLRKKIPGFSESEKTKEQDNPILVFYNLTTR